MTTPAETRRSKATAQSRSDGHGGSASRRRTRLLALGALGIVYGDIGTSPLYAFREAFAAQGDITVVRANVLGVLSLIVWSLIIVITVKYLVFVMRADAEGEGGILALTSLVPRTGDHHGKGRRRYLILLGIFGTALLYGDGMITPAISVLSAVEGISVVTDALDPLIVPLACVILIALFAFQRHGTGTIGAIFGPVMVVWFSTLGLLGLLQVIRDPQVLAAVNPVYGAQFFLDNGFTGLLVLGSVFLVVTGGEALYADMGHFGKRPIQLAWFVVVLPGLVLNYFGQGALLLQNPGAIDNPFFRLAPGWATVPLVLLSTAATVIASQALISGAFSLTMQAVQMGYLPRLLIHHTSESQLGQVYIATVNRALMVACIGLVIGFQTSGNLAAAYGVAVTSTMVVTTMLFYVVAREHFGWPRLPTLALCGILLVIDLAFFFANILKVPDGGWFPLVVGLLVFTAMTTWRRGRKLLMARVRKGLVATERFIADLGEEPRAPGAVAYLSADPGRVPTSLFGNLRHNNALHETVILLHVEIEEVPHVPRARRATVQRHEKGFWAVTVHYGFRDRIDVPEALRNRVAGRVGIDESRLSYIVGRENVLSTPRQGMARWRERLFALMTRNATDVAQFFCLPNDRLLEIGRPVEI